MVEKFQKFNKTNGKWQVYKKYSSGKTKIVNVKERDPAVPFRNIRKK